ncbi:MAG: HDIG domain-containing protein [Chloroflexi bacterium]|nr:HDIG domain-containing protein [Chloroflexota bacterium]
MCYRLWQFWQTLWAKPLTEEVWAEVAAVLNPQELKLFVCFPPNDQWHSVRVMQLLRSAGYEQAALLKAALLHDVGKTAVSLTIWERVIVVLGSKMWPHKAAGWGEGEARGWRRPFIVKAQHPTWGAEMATAAGCDELTIDLIQRHQDVLAETVVAGTVQDERLRALQWADDRS